MKNDLLSGLKIYIKENGKDALDNVISAGSFVYKNTDSKYTHECEALMICLTLGYHKKLNESNQSERSSVKKEIAESLNNNEGLDLDLCNRTIDILETALFEPEMPTPETPVEENKKPSVSSEEILTKTSAELNREKQLNKELTSIIANKDEQNKNLIKEINIFKNNKTYSQKAMPVLDEALIKAKKKFNTVLFFLIISVITIFIVYGRMKDKNTDISYINEWIYGEFSTFDRNFEDSKKIWIVNVVDMKVGNANQNNKWITRPGVQLKANAVQYLNPVFIYNSPVAYSMTFFIKIIDPTGTIYRNNTISPAGYSYSKSYQVRKGQSLEFDPGGWGSAGGGSYYPGTWKIELWYEGFCLYSGDVKLE
jgi:hypothetical protein